MGSQTPSPKRGQSPQSSAHVYCGTTAAWIKMPLGTEVDDIVLDGDPAPSSQKSGRSPSPIFGPCLLRPNGLMDQGGTWHEGGTWSRPHCARWGPSSPPQRGQSPQFSAHFYGRTAGCIKIPLGMEVGLVPGDFVFDGDSATSRKKGTPTPPNFWLMSIVAKRLDG